MVKVEIKIKENFVVLTMPPCQTVSWPSSRAIRLIHLAFSSHYYYKCKRRFLI